MGSEALWKRLEEKIIEVNGPRNVVPFEPLPSHSSLFKFGPSYWLLIRQVWLLALINEIKSNECENVTTVRTLKLKAWLCARKDDRKEC